MISRKIAINLYIVFQIFLMTHLAYAEPWLHLKDKHFIVYYNFKEDTSAARRVLRKAESYYDKIAAQIGYTRYSNFWTWNDRAKIIIFPNQETFVNNTQQPLWSRGYANHHSQLFGSRIIVTYRQEHGFLDGLLPHEISHLILRDFIGFDRPLPVWFDEGIAQLYEKDRKRLGELIMKPLAQKNQHIPFDTLFQMQIYQQNNADIVRIFYAQSLSIIDFLIRTYGSSAFERLCWNLKEGKDMDEALRSAYTYSISSRKDLEEKWLRATSR
ncbi:MAG: peptidase MA family metallohydrolase [Candidatus Omnitrophota bacterium]